MVKRNKKTKTWTVILSSGPQSPVKQFRLSKVLFYSSLVMIPLFILAIVGLMNIIYDLSDEKKALHTELVKKVQDYEEVTQEYKTLQAEAVEVQQTIEEFKAFEQRLSELDLEMPTDLEDAIDEGSGGMLYPYEIEDASDISARLIELREELPGLISEFEQTVERILTYEEELRTIPTIMPATEGRISSEFGNRKDPFTWRSTFHSGIDIAAPLDTPIFAAADGTVTLADWNGGYGKAIIIKHDDTYETLYGHLNRIDVDVGDVVQKGQQIGGMGTTGRSTGVHLHYEIRKDGELIDPYPYMTFHEQKSED
ncbi:Peptidase family M23 [Evansella caseinilytica]|uniref:Peptidase family M23 n=1 Tax=Evansella caseinilytica TaxID=1503961 RepID=A0A1H3UN19_9BACI|nr:M23 family metallopeptidase [Evansella caseinilytica]SDZ63225.1 Peptidase family M23 [Evansella caseinilytica]